MLIPKQPPSTGDANLDRTIKRVYDDINEVIGHLNKTADSPPSNTDASEGALRVVKQTDNTYIVSVKSKEGWINSQAGHFTFQDKKV